MPADTRMRVIRATIPAAIVAAIVVAPYGYAYALNRETLGERVDADIQLYSATLANYLATTPANVIHGGWSARFGQSERFLFPGVLTIVLAVLGLFALDRRRATLITSRRDRLRHFIGAELAPL
jgi:hypothetical protein